MADAVPDRRPPQDPPVPPGHVRVFDVAPEEDLLYSMSADGRRKFMHPVVHQGR